MGTKMPTYVSLFQKTDEGRVLTLEDTQRRRTRWKEIVKRRGGEIKGLYYGFGQYDIVAIVEVPDTESIAKVQLAYEQMGLTHVESFEVFEADEWDIILEDALV
ncbi:GYD domain-containing protein [Haloarcula sp. JP-L23]|uniref:GYD domain-containing protein n=1 Tax=Haloarcula sp. JP-L23 TaxID=2716717 RepID=UPI00140F35EC|nr:GYD domain-containing protein [Haloarcula sp. JP-L23]